MTDHEPQLRLFGIRHHGPGSARALLRALEAFAPEHIALEMPADVGEVLHWVKDPGMVPPVALLLYPPEEPQRGIFYPMAAFSPEWQSLRYAWLHEIPVTPFDLPFGNRVQLIASRESTETEATQSESNHLPWDPIEEIARVSGWEDGEQWWEEQVERFTDLDGTASLDLFLAVHDIMSELRQNHEAEVLRQGLSFNTVDLIREAYMRRTLRQLIGQGIQRIAVVCGALHTPALTLPTLQGKVVGKKRVDDTALLTGLKKSRITATWVPYSHERLTLASGYGAGIRSPGWYQHLWEYDGSDVAIRWLATAARVLRASGLDASSAEVIDSLRLATALTTMRRRHTVSLQELTESMRTVLCHGDETPLKLLHRQLIVGEKLGSTPELSPAVPLAKDIQSLQKRLRLKPATELRLLELDLRETNGLARSHMLHRMNLLDIPWGVFHDEVSGKGTFRESWELAWQPEYEIRIIIASMWGNTLEEAATAMTCTRCREISELEDLTDLLRKAHLAFLGNTMDPLLTRLDTLAATAADVRQLLAAIPSLARIARYGDVRGTQSARLIQMIESMFQRGLAGLSHACLGLDSEAAEKVIESIMGVTGALRLLEKESLLDQWFSELQAIVGSQASPLIRGWSTRELLVAKRWTIAQLSIALSQALSAAVSPDEAAAWATGLIHRSGSVLIHQPEIWPVIDQWLMNLEDERFVSQLPILRRAFSDFSIPQRRQIKDQLQKQQYSQLPPDSASTESNIAAAASESSPSTPWDHERSQRVIPILKELLGLN